MKLTHATGVVVTSLVALCGATACSDEGRPLAKGTRVRVTALGFASRPVIGDLIAIEATEVTLQRAGSADVVAIPLSDVTWFEVSTEKRRKGRGAGIGALVGLGVGAVVGYAAGDDCGAPDAPSIVCFSRPSSAAAVGLAGAGLGAVLGLIFAPRDTMWETVNPPRLELSVVPSARRSGGMGLAMSLSF